jgi:protein required for attachment to host cells
LSTLRVFIDVNLATHEQGTDRPGRTFKPGSSSRRSRLETADWHDLEEHRFARQVAGALEDLVPARNAKALFIVAPPRTLAELRRALHTMSEAECMPRSTRT